MAFLDSLKRVLGNQPSAADARLNKALEDWADSDATAPPSSGPSASDDTGTVAESSHASPYDIEQWRKKVKRILEKLPQSQAEWATMLAEGKALGLDDRFMIKSQLDEFTLLVRRAVADRHVTEEEHSKLDLARSLIGMTEDEAENLLHSVAAEAQAFFGAPIKGA
jgi:hypothetical protein